MTDSDAWDKPPTSPNCVTIFGGGIAGLTAAHELIERGFRVQLWEAATDQRQPQRGCEIGGMARTQWSRAHWPDERGLDNFNPLPVPAPGTESGEQRHGTRTKPIVHLPQKIAIDRQELTHLLVRRIEAPAIGANADPEAGPTTAEPEWGGEWSWQGVELSVRNWETMTDSLRGDFAAEAGKAMKPAFAKAGVTDVSEPYFDRAVQLWKLELKVGAHSCTVIFKGEFPTSIGELRPPADVFGVLSLWKDKGKDRFKVDKVLVLFQEWRPQSVRALGAWGSQDVSETLAEIITALNENPEILHLYLEVSDRDFALLTDAEALARALSVANIVQNFLPNGVRIDAASVAAAPTVPKARAKPAASKVAAKPAENAQKAAARAKLKANAEPQPPSRRRITAKLIINTGKENRSITLEVIPLSVFPTKTPDDTQILIGFRIREHWLPGEHGYRFFPSFYLHLFDTMKRTPILELTDKSEFSQRQEYAVNVDTPEPVRYVESPLTVFDNIHPTASHVLAFADGERPVALSRSLPLSFTELGEYVKVLFGSTANGGFAIRPRESTRYALKLFNYMTSCDARRSQYEHQSWWDFVDGDSYSEGIQTLLRKWPEALVAMNAKVADARSHGNSVIQLMLDNLRPKGYRDGTLRGPTSEAWLKYWRRYLEAQGVEFIHGKLTGIEVDETRLSVDDPNATPAEIAAEKATENQKRLWPIVECYEPRFPRDHRNVPKLMPGYFVLAISADQAVEVARGLLKEPRYQELSVPPFEKSAFAHLAKIDLDGLNDPEPSGDFRHFAGIQFYFAEDVFWVDAHVYYPDAPWGLTSISQVRFWEEFTDWEHGYRGIISVIVAIWDAPGQYTTRKTAWECTEEELAREVWAQIKHSVDGNRDGEEDGGSRFVVGSRARSGAVPDPLYWHLDDFIKYDETKKHYTNSAPFHIASPSGWPKRPGDPDKGYVVENHWAVCGMLAKTFTRIPSMEAANESARHVVNAILSQLERSREQHLARYRGTRCDIFDPEDREIEDFKWFKDLDEKLTARGLPHLVDILGLDQLTDSLLRGGNGDPLDPINVTRQLSRLVNNLPNFFRRW